MRTFVPLLVAAACAKRPPAPAPIPLAAGSPCEGADVDLLAAMFDERCVVDGEAGPLPPEVVVTVDPKLAARTGETASAAIVLSNAGAAPLAFNLTRLCAAGDQVSTRVLDAAGKRVDLVEESCGAGRGCGSRTVGIELEPGGRASFPFLVPARVSAYDDRCKLEAVGDLPRGTYTVEIEALFLLAPLEAPFTVAL